MANPTRQRVGPQPSENGTRLKTGVSYIRVESGRLLLPDQIGAEVSNMYPTEEGTLRSVWGPSPYIPNYGNGFPSVTLGVRIWGAGHMVRWDGKELLVAQWGNAIRVFQGWNAAAATPGNIWEPLVGPSGTPGGPPDIEGDFETDSKPRFPPQFVPTPGGMVIIPRGNSSTPYFYDGLVVGPLGYEHGPGAPVGWGPRTDTDPNDAGYHHDGANVNNDFKYCRLGTVTTEGMVSGSSSTSQVRGTLLRGSYRCALQWIDRWANLSPLSGRSNAVSFSEEDAIDTAASRTVEDLPKQVAWCSLQDGPDGTVGKILLRTKDELHSGTLALFEVPANAGEGSLAFATIPDNVTDFYPDNCPDSWLVRQAIDPIGVRPFKLYTVAFGRGFAANYEDDPGLIRWTMPGRWGTFPRNNSMYPDPKGAPITGMHAVAGGMLIFTESTTFLVRVNDSGEGFRFETLHSSIGCVAPSSIQTMFNGTTLWLGREGFYQYSGGEVSLASQDIDVHVRAFNRARMLEAVAAVDSRTRTYRCWVATSGSLRNDQCWEFNGAGWRRRSDMTDVSGVFVTNDHRRYMLATGRATVSGGSAREALWLLDHENQAWTPTSRSAILETSWFRAFRSERRSSPMVIHFWFRETENTTLSFDVYRDWREKTTQTVTVQLHPTDDIPPFWGTTALGATDSDGDKVTWKKRRPYWIRGTADISVRGAEVFKLRIAHTGDWDFVGISFDEVPHADDFRMPR